MWERIRGVWIEGKLQNLLMVLRYNKDSLFCSYKFKKYKLNLDCCLSSIKRWRLDKGGMTGFVDIEFINNDILTIIYYSKKRPFKNTTGEEIHEINFSTILEGVIESE